MVRLVLAGVVVAALGTQAPPPGPASVGPAERGVLLDDLPGGALKDALGRDPVLVIPIGRATEPHPAHLTLNADWRLIERIRHRLAATPGVAVATPATFVPAAGSPAAPAAAEFFADICRTLSRHGARRFLIVDVFRTPGPTATAAAQAAGADGLLLAFEAALDADAGHGERDETLLLLHLDRAAILDARAVAPDPARGSDLAESAMQRMLAAIARLKEAPLPPKRPASRPAGGSSSTATRQSGTEGDFRTIARMASLFGVYWRNQDPLAIAGLFAEDGDVRHPDGLVERGRQIIASNRAAIFADRRYANSRHPLQIATVTFRGPDAAVADGKWELTGVRDQAERQGPFTWVVVRRDGAWQIAAWRYADTPAGRATSR